MDPQQTAAEFQTTVWSLVIDARGDRDQLETLLRRYWSPIYGFIRRQGYSRHDAGDLTQEFLSAIVLTRGLIHRADPTRGRFRAFLKQSLRNFLIDQHRSNKRRRSGQRLDDTPEPATPEGGGRESDFDRIWASAIVEQALQRVHDACAADGLEGHWLAFEAHVVIPAAGRIKAPTLDDLARTIGAADANQASNMIQTVKRRFRRTLREVIAETVDSPEEIEPELAELRAYFG